jgi:two-component system KDP operon response regulator KdpE
MAPVGRGTVAKILVIDDDPSLLRALRVGLHAGGHEVTTAVNGEQGISQTALTSPDVVVLDLGLPDIDGQAVCKRIRQWSEVPIIILSASGAEDRKVAALNGGADDYVTKPFGMGELLARLRAAMRRASPAEDAAPAVDTPHFRIDLAAKIVTRADGEEIRLTPTQWHLVEVLVRNKGRLVTQLQLLHEVWGPQYREETNYLRVFMAQIRRKLEPDPSRPRYFVTEPGMGIRFVADGA